MAEALMAHVTRGGPAPTTEPIDPFSYTAYLLARERFPRHTHVFDYEDRTRMLATVIRPMNHERTLDANGSPAVTMTIVPPRELVDTIGYQLVARVTVDGKRTFGYTSAPMIMIPPACETHRCAKRWNNAMLDFFLNAHFVGTAVFPHDYAISKQLLSAFAFIETWPGVAIVLSTHIHPTDDL